MTKKNSFEGILEKLDIMHSELNQFVCDMKDISARGLKIIREKKHSIEADNTDFELYFETFINKFKKFSSKFVDFWQEVCDMQRQMKEKGAEQNSVISLKTFVTRAKKLSYTVGEFESAVADMRQNIKTPVLKANWWSFEVAVSDITNLSSKILFLSHEISKLAQG